MYVFVYVFHMYFIKTQPLGLVPVFAIRFAGGFSYCLINNLSDYWLEKFFSDLSIIDS